MTEEKKPITAQMLKEIGMNCWEMSMAGQHLHKLISRGYTFEEVREATAQYCYYSIIPGSGGNAIQFRLRPEFDPEARPCPHENDPELVCVKVEGDVWRCPICKRRYHWPQVGDSPMLIDPE